MNNLKIGNTEFTGEDLTKFGSTAISTIQNWGKTSRRNPMLGKNFSSSSPWAAAAGQAGSLTVDLLDAISALADDGETYNPYTRLGLYGLGGNLFDLGGSEIAGMGTAFLNILGNAKANATLDEDPAQVGDAIRSYGNNTRQAAGEVTDNDALLTLYNNTAYLPDNVRSRDFRNKTRLQDFTSSLASSFEGFNAGSSAGGWGAAIGGIFGGLASDIGIGIGRSKARNAARRTNRLARRTNRQIDRYLEQAAGDVDYLNDILREVDYMNTVDYGALGGPLNTHGADFLNGVTYIDAGGTHEENPNTGVPAGVDANGTPNLVEEGEVIWNDYVFSNRIEVPEDLCKKYKLTEGATFAEAVRKLTAESEKRPNSPIDKDTINSILTELQVRQEDIRMDIQAQQLAEQQRVAGRETPGISPQLAEALSEEFALGGNLFYPGGPLWDPESRLYLTEEQRRAQEAQRLAEEQAAAQAAASARPRTPAGSAYGTFKEGDYASNWNNFSRSGIIEYARRQKAAYDAAATPEEKKRIQDETVNTISLIQNGYAASYNRSVGKPRATQDKIVRAHQDSWNRMGGNYGFTNIADAVTLPQGHNSGDDAEHGWVDGLWGPYTSIRNAGSTLSSSEDLAEIKDIFGSMGLDYTPTIDYGTDGAKLYTLAPSTRGERLSRGYTPTVRATTGEPTIEIPDRVGERRDIENPSETEEDDWRKYLPAYGAGVAALNGILGRPDYTNADAILRASREMGRPLSIPVRTIGDYRRRRPFDERYIVNLANQRRMAGIRAAQNASAGNRAQQLAMSNVLAQTGQEGLAEIMRQAYLSNRQDDADVAAFNRGTNQFNASSINQRNFHQAGLNTQRQAQALSGTISGRGLRQNIRNLWDQNTGRNISTFLQGLADLYRDDVAYNQARGMQNQGYFRGYSTDRLGNIDFNALLSDLAELENNRTQGQAAVGAKGGKLNRKKRRF